MEIGAVQASATVQKMLLYATFEFLCEEVVLADSCKVL